MVVYNLSWAKIIKIDRVEHTEPMMVIHEQHIDLLDGNAKCSKWLICVWNIVPTNLMLKRIVKVNFHQIIKQPKILMIDLHVKRFWHAFMS